MRHPCFRLSGELQDGSCDCPLHSAQETFKQSPFNNPAKRLAHQQKDWAKTYNKKTIFKTRFDLLTDPNYQRASDPGAKRLLQIEEVLDDFDRAKWHRSEMQKDIHRIAINASMRYIVGEDFNTRKAKYLKMRHVKFHNNKAFFRAPRRVGKTVSIAMLAAAILVVVPKAKIGIFSQGERSADSMLDHVRKILKSVPKYAARIRQPESSKCIKIASLVAGEEDGVCTSYPCTVNGLKGVTAEWIVFEEYSRIPYLVWSEVVHPLLGVDGSCIIGISTPMGEACFIDPMLDNNPKHYNLHNYSLVCEMHAKSEHPEDCMCMTHILPRWKPISTYIQAREEMRDDPEMFQREWQAHFANGKNSVFKKEDVDMMVKLPFANNMYNRARNNRIFVGVDPTSGGRSEMALCSVLFDGDGNVVVGLCTHLFLLLLLGGGYEVGNGEKN